MEFYIDVSSSVISFKKYKEVFQYLKESLVKLRTYTRLAEVITQRNIELFTIVSGGRQCAITTRQKLVANIGQPCCHWWKKSPTLLKLKDLLTEFKMKFT